MLVVDSASADHSCHLLMHTFINYGFLISCFSSHLSLVLLLPSLGCGGEVFLLSTEIISLLAFINTKRCVQNKMGQEIPPQAKKSQQYLIII